MANELNYYGDIEDTGLTIYAKVYNQDGTQLGGNINCTEVNSDSIYIGNMIQTAPRGQYGVRFYNGENDTILGQGLINWSGSVELIFAIDDKLNSGSGSSNQQPFTFK